MPLECHRAGLIFGGEIFPGSHVVGGGRLFGRRSGGSSAGGGPDQPDADGQLDFLPILASLVDKANPGDLYQKFQLLILACSAGTLAAWQPGCYCRILSVFTVTWLRVRRRQPGWLGIFRSFYNRYPLQVRPFQLGTLPRGFLIYHALAMAVWTVGALCALHASAVLAPEVAATAVLLSGLVNAFAAISLSLLVDPQASLLTDRGHRPEVCAAAWHLSLGNVVGSLPGLVVFTPGSWLIGKADLLLARHGSHPNHSLCMITLLACTAYASRIAAVETGARATALLVYNLFSMVMRLAGQVLAPSLAVVAVVLNRTEYFCAVCAPGVCWEAAWEPCSGCYLCPSLRKFTGQRSKSSSDAGMLVGPELKCTATLLSSVWWSTRPPPKSRIEACTGKRRPQDVYSMVMLLGFTMLLGTRLSQILLLPAARLIRAGAEQLR